MSLETFLDETPGEVRGVVVRDGRVEQIFIVREGDPAEHALGARSVGRVSEVGAGGAWVDLGAAPAGFLPPGKAPVREGDRIEVEVVAEPRERKGPMLKLSGSAEGPPRLLAAGPTVEQRLGEAAPGVEPETGVVAIQAVWDAEEEALARSEVFAGAGIDVSVERTRALVAVDIDHAVAPGRDARAARARANREGLMQAARMIRLRRWGGLVAVDLVGTALDGEAVTRTAREAFSWVPEAAFGPVSRFGLLQISLPWRMTPIEDVLNGWDGGRRARTRAIDLTRRMRHALLSDTRVARLTAVCAPDEAALAGPLVARLGPRAGVRADPAVAPGRSRIEEG